MDPSDLILAVAAVVAVVKKKKKVKRTRSRWTKNWLLKRKQYSHINLVNELRFEPGDWYNYLRMDEETYLELLALVTPKIVKQSTHLREPISAHERLTATLRFLATGRNYEDLKFTTVISPQALGHIIPETCQAIYSVLHKDYLKFPSTEEEWLKIARQFEYKWNFPHCLGAVDGKHVQISPPPGSGSYFYNYKGFHSLVLIAIANASYEIILCDFGTNGRISDGGVIENTAFYDKLVNKTLHLPQPSKCANSAQKLPFVFIGDDAFSLRTDFLKPYSQKELNAERRVFNYRLSRARRIIENVFGIMAARFQIFHRPIGVQLKNTEKFVMACCVLHNFLRRKLPESYTPPECLDTEEYENGTIQLGIRPTENTLVHLQRTFSRNAQEAAKQTRNIFLDYFNNEGAVSWQNKFTS